MIDPIHLKLKENINFPLLFSSFRKVSFWQYVRKTDFAKYYHSIHSSSSKISQRAGISSPIPRAILFDLDFFFFTFSTGFWFRVIEYSFISSLADFNGSWAPFSLFRSLSETFLNSWVPLRLGVDFLGGEIYLVILNLSFPSTNCLRISGRQS